MFRKQFVHKSKHTFYIHKKCYEIVPFMRYVEKCSRVRYTIDNAICNMRSEWQMTESKIQAHSLYLPLISIPQQQCLRERASFLQYT
jgi:hypothetical protein